MIPVDLDTSGVFLDTSGLIAVINTDDRWHAQAEKSWVGLVVSSASLVTTFLVLIEIADGLSRIRYRSLAIQIVERLRSSGRVDIAQSNNILESKAWQLFRDRPDKEWGMTDCTSMTYMSENGIVNAFTADKHFAQAGFNILLE